MSFATWREVNDDDDDDDMNENITSIVAGLSRARSILEFLLFVPHYKWPLNSLYIIITTKINRDCEIYAVKLIQEGQLTQCGTSALFVEIEQFDKTQRTAE